MKTLIKNARIYDGTGNNAFMGSVLIEDEKITAVIPDGQDAPADADKVIDLGGLSLSPGFIDGHSHNDWFAIRKDPFPFFEPFLRQGVTIFVTGNCGLSVVGFEDGNEHVDLMGGGQIRYDRGLPQGGRPQRTGQPRDPRRPLLRQSGGKRQRQPSADRRRNEKDARSA